MYNLKLITTDGIRRLRFPNPKIKKSLKIISESTQRIISASFDADSDNELSVAGNSSLQFSDEFSMGLWLKLNVVNATNQCFMHRWDGNGFSFELFDSDLYVVVSDNSGSQSVNQAASPSINTWYFLVATVGDGALTFYINNVEIGNTPFGTLTSPTLSTSLVIGGRSDGTGGPANGYINRAFKYDRKITEDEIEFLYNNGKGRKYSQLGSDIKTDLISWWELKELDGTRIDSHGSNDLTENGDVPGV